MTRETQMRFRSRDGKTTIHAVKWAPVGREIRAIVQIAHGMDEYIERYREFAEYLNGQGFLVVGHDHLGHGASVTSRAEWGFFEERHPSDTLVRDMHALRRNVQRRYPSLPYFMLGHSMGSYLLRKYLCIYGDGLAGAILVGTGSMPDIAMRAGLFICHVYGKVCGQHYRSRFLQSLSYGRPYKRYDVTGADESNSWLSKNVENVHEYYEDPRCTFLFTVNGYRGLMEAVLYDNQLENVRRMPPDLPVLLASGADDPVGDMGAGVLRVYDLMKNAGVSDVGYKLYENDRHEILNETDREVVYADLAGWLEKHLSQGEE